MLKTLAQANAKQSLKRMTPRFTSTCLSVCLSTHSFNLSGTQPQGRFRTYSCRFVHTQSKTNDEQKTTKQPNAEQLPILFVYSINKMLRMGGSMTDYTLCERLREICAKRFPLYLNNSFSNQVVEHFAHIVLNKDKETLDRVKMIRKDLDDEAKSDGRTLNKIIEYIEPLMVTKQPTAEQLPILFAYNINKMLRMGGLWISHDLCEQLNIIGAKKFPLNLNISFSNDVVEYFAHIVLTNDKKTFSLVEMIARDLYEEDSPHAQTLEKIIQYIEPLMLKTQ